MSDATKLIDCMIEDIEDGADPSTLVSEKVLPKKKWDKKVLKLLGKPLKKLSGGEKHDLLDAMEQMHMDGYSPESAAKRLSKYKLEGEEEMSAVDLVEAVVDGLSVSEVLDEVVEGRYEEGTDVG